MKRTLVVMLTVGACLATDAWGAATFVLVNADGPGEGLNDTTSVSPVGGNTGTTLGEQRQIAFQFAADQWGDVLDSAVPVRVDTSFDALFCEVTETGFNATLGSAGPNSFYANGGLPLADTLYPAALANRLQGRDLDTSISDITARFNSVFGTPTCDTPLVWYYGLDGSPPVGTVDFVTVVLHELAHGIGFLDTHDLDTGETFQGSGLHDIFSVFLEDHSTGKLYPDMTDAERVTASTDDGDLHWVGPHTVASSGFLIAGRHASGHVQMYAPVTSMSGSSISHFDIDLAPNQIMEPQFTTKLPVNLDREVLRDMGWGECGDAVVDVDEECDDGNTNDGDCCSSTCLFVDAGSTCGPGAACSEDKCDGAGTCNTVAMEDGATCDDGVYCNGTDSCVGGVCDAHGGDPCLGGGECASSCNESSNDCFAAASTACDDGDGNVCTEGGCDGGGDCVAVPVSNGASCGAGNACNADQCSDGTCTSVPIADGTFCGAGDPCNTAKCSAGSCELTPRSDGTSCDDGNACTDGDHCVDGQCEGIPLDCSHLDSSCATGVCESGTCVAEPVSDGTSCGEVGVCNAAECSGGACVDVPFANGTSCGAGDVCNAAECSDGACVDVPLANGTSCGAGDACNTAECSNGACVDVPRSDGTNCGSGDSCHTRECRAGVCSLVPLTDGTSCGAGDACNAERCEAGVCGTTPRGDGTSCDDGVFCNGADACVAGACSAHAGDPCAAGTVCANLCDEESVTCLVPAGESCSSGVDACSAGVCDGFGSCVDEVVCNALCERCDAVSGCESACAAPLTFRARPSATDALFVLRVAVRIDDCEPCLCDVNGNGNIAASDALAVLSMAVGEDIELACPAGTSTTVTTTTVVTP